MSKINNTQIENANDNDVLIPIHNLTEYRDNYSKTFGRIQQYYTHEPPLTNDGANDGFPGNSASLKFKQKITGKTENNGTKTGEMVPLKYLSNFWRTLEMPLINFKINLILTSPVKCDLLDTNVNQAATFPIRDTKLYVSAVTLSSQDNSKLLQQLKSGFKSTINWNKYQ